MSAFFALLIAALIVVFAVKFRRTDDDEVGEAIHGSLPLELLWTFIPLGITMVMFVWGAQVFFHMTRPPRGRDGNLRRRQAVDVEAAAHGRRARDQRAARPGRPAGEADHGLGGRDPQLLRPRLPREGGRRAGALQHALVHGDEAGALPHLLRRVLRHQALEHDRLGDRDGAGRLPGVAGRRTDDRRRWPTQARSCSTISPASPAIPRRRHRARPVAEGRLRPTGAAAAAARTVTTTSATFASRS